MRVTGWLQAGAILLVLGILVGTYGVAVWATVMFSGPDADSGAKIASPIMMLAAFPLLLVGIGMTVSGIVGERRMWEDLMASRRRELAERRRAAAGSGQTAATGTD